MPTLINNDTVEVLLEEIKEKLKEFSKTKNVVQYYWKAGVYTEKLLRYCLTEEELSLPIDIRKVAEVLGIQIEEVNINEFSNENVKRLNHKIAQLSVQKNYFTGEREAIIYADKFVPLSSKRYAIANEIVQYILHEREEEIYESYFVMPMCPVKIDELVTEIFAIFLLIPLRCFLNEFYEYVTYRNAEQKIPISTEEWIKYLSERAGVSEYYVAYGYQYLRSAAYWIGRALEIEQGEDSNMTEEEKKQNTVPLGDRKEIVKWLNGEKFDLYKEWIFQSE